jgi:hypothetical protein
LDSIVLYYTITYYLYVVPRACCGAMLRCNVAVQCCGAPRVHVAVHVAVRLVCMAEPVCAGLVAHVMNVSRGMKEHNIRTERTPRPAFSLGR